jgi:AraC family transcriptional regulator, arabinose operon regulatory protein
MDLTHYIPFQPSIADSPRLSVARFGVHEEMPPRLVHRPAGNVDYLFMLFHTQTIVGTAPDACQSPENTFILWEPGQSHYYGCADQRWDHSWIHFSGTAADDLVQASSLPRNRPVVLHEPYLFERFLSAVQLEITSHDMPDDVIIGNLLHNLLRELTRSLSGEHHGTVPADLLEVKAWLETHYREPVRLSDLAARSCLSVSRFCACFKHHFGYPAIEYAVRFRMEHAAFLLRDVNMRVKEVAERVGYSDLYHFSKLFRKHHGVSPRGFRARMRE